jgi:phosphoribosylformimino-5-aminoimidazole carboxamide ribotide isomerase
VLLLPAIDILGGRCVSVVRGDIPNANILDSDPIMQARSFEAQGFEKIQIVDLDGVLARKPVNLSVIEAVLRTVRVPLLVGGGIQSMEAAEVWLSKGVHQILIGTAAVRSPELVKAVARRFPGRVVVGLDMRDGKVAVQGRELTSAASIIEIAKEFDSVNLDAIIYTDLTLEGTLQGMNIKTALEIADAVRTPVIVGGGFSSLRDLESLLTPRARTLAGAVIGRALYEKTFDVQAALAMVKSLRS